MNIPVLFILGGSLLLLLVLGIYFRKAIHLFFISIVYGKYSYDFLKTYKGYFIRSPFQYCFRDDFVSHLLYVLAKKDDVPSYKSYQDISFENTCYFIDYKTFVKQRGEPFCFNAFRLQNPDCEIKAIGYQSMVNGSKAVKVFYFMNDSFFMGEYIFKNPKSMIKSALLAHFLNNESVPVDNFYIENSRERIIHYMDTGFTVDIKYLSKENKEIIDNLNEYYTKITAFRIGQKA